MKIALAVKEWIQCGNKVAGQVSILKNNKDRATRFGTTLGVVKFNK